MELKTTEQYESGLISFSKFCGALSLITGGLVLAGWAYNVAALKSVLPGLVTMKSNTAFCFLLIGISILLFRPEQEGHGKWKLLARTAGGIVALVGLLTFCEYLLGWDLGIDQLLFKEDPGAVMTVSPNRMALNTSFNFIMIGLGLAFLDVRGKRGSWPSQSLVAVAGIISSLALIGYLYGVKAFYFGIGKYTAMALHTSVLFVFVSIGILFARPRHGVMGFVIADNISGMILRRLLPIVILVPLVLGRIKIWSERAGLVTNEFGVSFVATANIFFVITYVFWLVRVINRVDEDRETAQRSSRDLEERYKTLFQETTDSIFISNMSGRFIDVNKSSCERLGYSRNELLAMSPNDLESPGNKQLFEQRMSQIAKNKHLVFDSVLIRRDGKPIPVEISAQVIDYGGKPAILSMARDVTERKRFEDELKGKIHDLEVFNRISVDRELKMVELKKKIEDLEERLKGR